MSDDAPIVHIVDDAEALRQEMGLKRWDVLGQSFGGFCLMHYLAAHPDDVDLLPPIAS